LMQPVLMLDLAVPVEHPERLVRGVQFAENAAPRYSGFEHENGPSDVARGLCRHPLKVGLASEARSTIGRLRSREHEDDFPDERRRRL
jgi:hypothetical protein